MTKVIVDDKAEEKMLSFSEDNQAQALRVINLFKEWRFMLTERHLKRINKKLYELRSGQVRLIFGMVRNIAVIVNIFLKKTQKTPLKEVKTSLKRLKQYL